MDWRGLMRPIQEELERSTVVAGLLADMEKRLERVREAGKLPGPELRIMEVCGTHTMALHRTGLAIAMRDRGVEFVSGPGCPVCVTPDGVIHEAVRLVREREDLVLATFGDLLRVPSGGVRMKDVPPAKGSRVQVVFSPDEVLDIARNEPSKEVVLLSSGFETTVPAIAWTMKRAYELGIENLTFYSSLFRIKEPMEAILTGGEVRLDGLLLPGHVSMVIGTDGFEFLKKWNVPSAVGGFSAGNIIRAVLVILDIIDQGADHVRNEYTWTVKAGGNPEAMKVMDEILEPVDIMWRGLGLIPHSGLGLREQYAHLDARGRFDIQEPDVHEAKGCRCGDVLRGVMRPPQCGLFGKACTPESPRGPCMVSSEGSCLAHFLYGG